MTHDDWTTDHRDLLGAMRAHYAAPAAEGYWDTLEARILAHVAQAGERHSWWTELAEMARPGMVAAAALVLAASLAMARSRQIDATNAYASVISPASAISETALQSPSVGDGDAAIHFLLSR